MAALLVCSPYLSHAVPIDQREFDWVLRRTPDLAAGAQLYETCAACHGTRGEGVADGSVPAIAGQYFMVIAKQLVDFRKGIRRDPRMEHFTNSNHLAYSQQVADVAAYLSTLPRFTSNRVFPAEVVGQGAALYGQSCERCHGVAGEGKEDALTPRVASQHFEYLLRQFDDAETVTRPALQRAHGPFVAKLSRKDVVAIASYLSSLYSSVKPVPLDR